MVSDDTPDDDNSDSTASDNGDSTASDDDPRVSDAEVAVGDSGRDIVVPLRLYKTVTVFSTLIAIVSILGGFVLLDRGTQRATASPEDVNLLLVAIALALIVGGSAIYAFSTRFRTAGMGKSKDDTAEDSDNG